MQKDIIPVEEKPTQERPVNAPGPNHEEVPKHKIDPETETHIDPKEDGDGQGA